MAGQSGTDRWVMTNGIFQVGGCYLVTAACLAGVWASARAGGGGLLTRLDPGESDWLLIFDTTKCEKPKSLGD